MVKEETLYLAAGSFFWSVFSAWYLVFESGEMSVNNTTVVFESLKSRAIVWELDAEALVGWIADERKVLLLERKELSKNEAWSLLQKIGELSSSAVYAEAQKLRFAAHHSRSSFQQLDENALVFYYYCGWLLLTLNAFRHILEDVNAEIDYTRQAFEQIQPTINGLAQQLQEELDLIAEQEQVEEATASLLREKIETVTGELVSDWRDAVYSAADQLASE